jgi:magnesium-transporting ATPase (P-type)
MDQGVFVADVEKYKAYCGFPAEDKQSIVQFHKDNGDITLSLTGGIYDTLPQMESDISVVSAEEKLNCVRLNSDILVREKKYELVPLCINWSRIFYRNIVHILQYVLLVQVALGASVLLGFLLSGKEPYHYFPMLLTGISAIILSGINLFRRLPGPHLEDNKEVLKDDRVASLQVLVIVPFIMGVTEAIATLLARQIALYASGGTETASSAALITFLFSSYFSSLSIKFDQPLITCFKNLGKTELISALCNVGFALLLFATPLKSLWQIQNVGSGFSFWILFFVFVLSLLPAIMMEWMKFLKYDVSAFGEKHKNDEEKGELK